MTKLIIFDFDGTLGDTCENIVKTMQETMSRKGYPVPGEEAICATIGLPLAEGFKMLEPGMGEEEMAACAALYREVFEEWRERLVPQPFPGVRETLAQLHGRGLMLSVASSRKRPSLVGFIHDMGLEPYISYVLGVDDAPKPKPDPAPVLKTLQELKTDASEAIVVGDMPVDILMGSRAGARTVGVTWGNGSREALGEAGADHIIDSIGDLLNLI